MADRLPRFPHELHANTPSTRPRFGDPLASVRQEHARAERTNQRNRHRPTSGADPLGPGRRAGPAHRRDRLEALESHTFWLSPTPDVPGSKGWDAALERIATWGRFRDRATGCTYVHLNTHFDHRGEHARQESARLIRERLATIDAAGLPLVMTGDLNSRPTSVGYRILTRDTIANAFPPLVDAMHASREGRYGPPSTTVSGFRGIGREGDIIDYVLVSPGVAVQKHGILPDSWDGRFPSDHLPVLATLTMRCR